MKSKAKSSKAADQYGLIEALEPRIAPAAIANNLPANPKFVTASAGTSLLVKAGEVLTTGSSGGGAYLLYVAAGEVLVHTTDLNNNGQLDFNEITGLSVGAGTQIVSFVDIHGDVVTDLNPNGSLTDNGKGDVLLDANITSIDLRSLTTADFTGTSTTTPAQLVNNHLAMSSYSIFGNIYAGGGVGSANNPDSGIQIDTSGFSLQQALFNGSSAGTNVFPSTAPTPSIGGIYAGTAASGQPFSFGASGSPTDIHGNLFAFTPANGETGASIYNVSAAAAGEAFNIGTVEAGNGGFNAPGGSIGNVALQGETSGAVILMAGNAGMGTVGHAGGSILNFSDTGATLGELLLQSGNGGTGLTGSGGSAGLITFDSSAPINVNSHVVLNFGSGGSGYNGGSHGGETPSGTFTTPEGMVTTAQNVVTTMHTVGSIGQNTPFDFNGDGLSDAVFSTNNPNQVVVALGTGSSNYLDLSSSDYIYLNGPAQVDSIVVGDFTGNGHPDIAVASGVGSFAGVEVFLSQYNPKTGAFEGFSAPLYTPVPSLGGIKEGGEFTAITVTNLVAGNFTGPVQVNGKTYAPEDLAVVFGLNGGVGGQLMFLNAETDAAHPDGTGYFYANFSNGNLPFIVEPAGTYIATALTQFAPGQGHDVIIGTTAQKPAAGSGETGVTPGSFEVISYNGGNPTAAGNAYGYIDSTPLAMSPNWEAFLGLTLTVTEGLQNPANPAGPGNPIVADVVALSLNPVGYLATFQGDGAGGFTLETGSTTNTATTVTNPGLLFIPPPPAVPNPVAIVTVPDPTTGLYSSVAILDVGLSKITVENFNSTLTTATAGSSWGVAPLPGISVQTAVGNYAFDVYYPTSGSSGASGAGAKEFGFLTAGTPPPTPGVSSDPQSFVISEPGGGINSVLLKDSGYFLTGGNGGNSLSGAGGAGGTLGQSLTITGTGASATGTGTLSFEFPLYTAFDGLVVLVAGNGGSGFTSGGAGGALSGISVTYASGTPTLSGDALLFAGNGGQGLIGTGGNGGSLSQLYIVSGDEFVGGNGGIGTIGGSGGTLYGNTEAGLITAGTNNVDPVIYLFAGNGATGITGGGNGGSILLFVDLFNPFTNGAAGYLQYVAGSGGNAVAGHAGVGGSILNSSPSSVENTLTGDIYLQAGTGGYGLLGASGGGITNFIFTTTIGTNPTSSTIIAGSGGNATVGTGGAGGSISNVSVAAAGIGVSVPVTYNRTVAGEGGSSEGGAGGAGGSVSNVDTVSTSPISQNLIAAGAGGAGLNAGGAGGSVISATADAGSSNGTGKVVIIAGDGGSAYGGKPANPNDPTDIAFSIGAVNGPGGNGGSIVNFTQPVNVNADVDLIAGNGGATFNHSVAFGNATTDNSGKGGSLLNIAVTGNIGNSNSSVAIKSYNDIYYESGSSNNAYFGTYYGGQSMQDFIDNYVLGNISAPMNDSVGNVGIVAGAAGFVESSPGASGPLQPSNNGINGSVSNVRAENIMSMIAGNVDLVAGIQSLTNYNVTQANGILGAAKEVYYNPVTQMEQDITQLFNSMGQAGVFGQLNYISAGLVPPLPGALTDTPLPGGGELIDGAFIADNIRNILSPRDFIGTETA